MSAAPAPAPAPKPAPRNFGSTSQNTGGTPEQQPFLTQSDQTQTPRPTPRTPQVTTDTAQRPLLQSGSKPVPALRNTLPDHVLTIDEPKKPNIPLLPLTPQFNHRPPFCTALDACIVIAALFGGVVLGGILAGIGFKVGGIGFSVLLGVLGFVSGVFAGASLAHPDTQ